MKLDHNTSPLAASAPRRGEQPVAGLFWRIVALLFGDVDNAAGVDVGVGVGACVALLLLPHAADSTSRPPIKITRAVRLPTVALRSRNRSTTVFAWSTEVWPPSTAQVGVAFETGTLRQRDLSRCCSVSPTLRGDRGARRRRSMRHAQKSAPDRAREKRRGAGASRRSDRRPHGRSDNPDADRWSQRCSNNQDRRDHASGSKRSAVFPG